MISGFTTTGSSILPRVEALDKGMLFWRSFSHWIGGMGILVFMLALLPAMGGATIHILRAESPGPNVAKVVPKIRESAKITYLIYLALTLLLVILYLAGGMPLFDSLCIAFGTAGTGRLRGQDLQLRRIYPLYPDGDHHFYGAFRSKLHGLLPFAPAEIPSGPPQLRIGGPMWGSF